MATSVPPARGAGFYIFTNPGLGLMTLTLVLTMICFVSGLIGAMVAFEVKAQCGHGAPPPGPRANRPGAGRTSSVFS